MVVYVVPYTPHPPPSSHASAGVNDVNQARILCFRVYWPGVAGRGQEPTVLNQIVRGGGHTGPNLRVVGLAPEGDPQE